MTKRILAALLLVGLLLTTACTMIPDIGTQGTQGTQDQSNETPEPSNQEPAKEPLFTCYASLAPGDEMQKITVDYLPEGEAVDADARRVSVYMGDRLIWQKDMIMGNGYGTIAICYSGYGDFITEPQPRDEFDSLFYWECIPFDHDGGCLFRRQKITFTENGEVYKPSPGEGREYSYHVWSYSFFPNGWAGLFVSDGYMKFIPEVLQELYGARVLVDTCGEVLLENTKDKILDFDDKAFTVNIYQKAPTTNNPFASKVSLRYDVNGDGVLDYIGIAPTKSISVMNTRRPTIIYDGADHSIIWSDDHSLESDEKGALYLRLNEETGEAQFLYWYCEKTENGEVKLRYNTFSIGDENAVVMGEEKTKTFSEDQLRSDAQQADEFAKMLEEINQLLSAGDGFDRVYLIMDNTGEELRYSTPDALVDATQLPLDLNAWIAD